MRSKQPLPDPYVYCWMANARVYQKDMPVYTSMVWQYPFRNTLKASDLRSAWLSYIRNRQDFQGTTNGSCYFSDTHDKA